jgi:hypothetical protein
MYGRRLNARQLERLEADLAIGRDHYRGDPSWRDTARQLLAHIRAMEALDDEQLSDEQLARRWRVRLT